MTRGIPMRTGLIDEVLLECEMYGLCRYTIEMFPWIFMIEDVNDEPVPLANSLIVALYLLQTGCEEVIERANKKGLLEIGFEKPRTSWFEDLVEMISWPMYSGDRESPFDIWRNDKLSIMLEGHCDGIYLSVYPKDEGLRGQLMTCSLNDVIEREKALKDKFRRKNIFNEVLQILGISKPPFFLDHGSVVLKSFGVDGDELKPDAWKLGAKQRDQIIISTEQRKNGLENQESSPNSSSFLN
jgi:hypothetical protein